MKLFTSLLRHQATLALTALLLMSSTQAATLQSSVNRNQINSDQTITLTVSYDKRVSASKLNLEPLRNDFDIISIRPKSDSFRSYDNGRFTKVESTVWSITLAAKQTGDLLIPTFDIDGDKSTPITIQVEDGGVQSNNDKALTISVRANNQSVFESQQLLLNVELSAEQGLSNLNSTSRLEINGAQVIELGQGNEQRVDNGIVRNIYTIRYAIFPSQVGTLRIPPLSFTGVKGLQRSYFGNSGGEQVVARSSAFDITVKASDKTHSPWFAADNVELESQWSGDTASIIAGEPITRTLIIRASGQLASAIPPLVRASENGYKSYQDQAQLDSKKTSNGYISTRVESEAIVVSTAGTLTLPAISIKWWDVNNSKWQEASVAEQVLTVLPSNKAAQPSISPTTSINTPQAITSVSQPTETHWLWPVISGVLLLMCLVQSYFLWKLSSNKKKHSVERNSNINESESSAWSTLNKSFKLNDTAKTRQALGRWAQTIAPGNEYLSLSELANYSNNFELNTQLNDAISQLDNCLYKEEDSFDSQHLKTHVTALRREIKESKKTSKKNNELTPLYKN